MTLVLAKLVLKILKVLLITCNMAVLKFPHALFPYEILSVFNKTCKFYLTFKI